jgi:hypothetical protein
MMRSGLPFASTSAATTDLVNEVPKVWPASPKVPPPSLLMLLVGVGSDGDGDSGADCCLAAASEFHGGDLIRLLRSALVATRNVADSREQTLNPTNRWKRISEMVWPGVSSPMCFEIPLAPRSPARWLKSVWRAAGLSVVTARDVDVEIPQSAACITYRRPAVTRQAVIANPAGPPWWRTHVRCCAFPAHRRSE